VRVFNPRKIDRPDTFRESLVGTVISGIERDGKELRFLLANQNSFNVHLMLHGKFFVCPAAEAEKPSGKMAALDFDDGLSFAVADFQGLCKVTLNARGSKVPDALAETFTPEYFSGVIKKNQWKNIKALLIDQQIVRGIGNAYVDEILYAAGISPESVAGKIPEDKAVDLYKAIPDVLNWAIQKIREISPDIINGEERSFLKVHNHRIKATEKGEKIIVKDIATKKTYFADTQEKYI
jgi:formamidopyrimidine-DNA glycosylase